MNRTMQSETSKKPLEKHHIQETLCETRPPYRQGKKLTAVKIYTINSESQHLYIYGVPKINLRSELKSLCMKYGPIKNIHAVSDVETEIFTECYHVQFEKLASARIAKIVLDNRSFYGSLLHVCYAPECESLEETKSKLNRRKFEVARKISECNKRDAQDDCKINAEEGFDQQNTRSNVYNDSCGRIQEAQWNYGNTLDSSADYKHNERTQEAQWNYGNIQETSIDYKQSVSFVKRNNCKNRKRTFTNDLNRIYEAEDPILTKRLCRKNMIADDNVREETIEKCSDTQVHGPSMEDFQNRVVDNSDVSSVFVPAPVVKSNLNVCAKRIVFRKKEFGLHDSK